MLNTVWSGLLGGLQRWLPRGWRPQQRLPTTLWNSILDRHPFLDALGPEDRALLERLCLHFLAEKEFHGAHGLTVTDDMALSIAAQACLPLLHMRAPNGEPGGLKALDWYGDFVGIVVQPGAALAPREVRDTAGVVHRYHEVIAGEAMDRGPVMLSWDAVSQAGAAAEQGSNVVIHEFVHKMDMLGMPPGEAPDGAPPIHRPLWGQPSLSLARAHWRDCMGSAYDRFREALNLAERFGGEMPWLDGYAAQNPAEFFAVSAEAYFVNRGRFSEAFPDLTALYDGFFRAG